MDNIHTALHLLKRQAELENRLRQPGGLRVTSESELYALRERLQRYPEAVNAILQMAATMKRPVDSITSADVCRYD